MRYRVNQRTLSLTHPPTHPPRHAHVTQLLERGDRAFTKLHCHSTTGTHPTRRSCAQMSACCWLAQCTARRLQTRPGRLQAQQLLVLLLLSGVRGRNILVGRQLQVPDKRCAWHTVHSAKPPQLLLTSAQHTHRHSESVELQLPQPHL